MNEKIFKAYDVRGIYPGEIDEAAVKAIAKAYAVFACPEPGRRVAVGHDVRLSSPSLHQAVIEGLTEMGVDVIDIGQGPTELIYFAVGAHNLDGGIQVSASHNPAEYNGLKMVRGGVEALSSDNGLLDIKTLALANALPEVAHKGSVTKQNLTEEYLEFLYQKFGRSGWPSEIKIVANNNFGLSGVLAKRLLQEGNSRIEMIGLNDTPDGSFPKGRPDPLVLENRAETSELVKNEQADLGVAWDADGDRFYLVDENGVFVEGCHLTAKLAEYLLQKNPGEKIIYDPRNVWAVEQTVKTAGGVAVLNKAGHTFIKNRMKKEQALFAGEMSGHFYFRDFYFADNGLIPFLLVLSIIGESGQSVSEMFKDLRENFHVSGEINFKVTDISAKIAEIEQAYGDGQVDRTDGLSLMFDDWRFNLRSSNTEPLLRLNIEGKNKQVVDQKLAEITELIQRD
jgi:phosphomannomutase